MSKNQNLKNILKTNLRKTGSNNKSIYKQQMTRVRNHVSEELGFPVYIPYPFSMNISLIRYYEWVQ